MVDYKKDTGSTGQMMIRDTGSVVEFWITSGNSSTFTSAMPWGYTINGSTNNNREFNYKAGSGWEKVGSWTVTTDQTVTFRLYDTGTTGLGGPTTLSASIERASVPDAPALTISNVTGNSVSFHITYGSNNGAAITARQLARNTSNTITGASIGQVAQSDVLIGLSMNTTYYFWARTYNAKGWGPWSAVKSAKTLTVPAAPGSAIISGATQTSFVVSFTDNGNGGSAINSREVGYSTTNVANDAFGVDYNGVTTVTGLVPATTYYVWTRVRNSTGWSPWSAVRTVRTVAGAYITVGGVVKEAIPYVNVGGVWKLARPWVRVAGVWKETL